MNQNYFYIVYCEISDASKMVVNPVAYYKSESNANKFCKQIQQEAESFGVKYYYYVEKTDFND